MKTILLPTDFSDQSIEAVDYAIALFGTESAQYILMNSYYTPDAGATMVYSVTPMLADESRASLLAMTERIQKTHGVTLRIKTESRLGSVAESCRQMCKSGGIDLVVMSTTGASGLKEVLIGSNAAATLEASPCPMIIVPAKAKANKPVRIGLATDYIDLRDTSALAPLFDIMEQHQARLHFVHVQDGTWEDFDDLAFEKADIPSSLLKFNHRFHELHADNVEAGIHRFVDEYEPDLLVVIGHRYPFFKRLFHHSVSKDLSMHLKIPMLALHGQAENE